ncbi:MAG: hypothetical protein WC788_02325 [Candidatus Paceibacterota bacterium]
MGNTDIQTDLGNIKIELDKIGADYEIDIYGNIQATLPKTSTIASVPFKDKKNRRTPREVRERYYFQNGVAILYPSRNNYLIDSISGYNIIMTHINHK